MKTWRYTVILAAVTATASWGSDPTNGTTLTKGVVFNDGVFYSETFISGKIYYDKTWGFPTFDVTNPAAITAAIESLSSITDPALLEKTLLSLALAATSPGADTAAINSVLYPTPDGQNEDGYYYVNGAKATGNINGTYYVDGEPANGQITPGGTYYADGIPANGVQADEKYYVNGVLSNGSENGTLYVAGSPASGWQPDENDPDALYYVAGTPANGVIGSAPYDIFYVNGLPFSGTLNGVIYLGGKAFFIL